MMSDLILDEILSHPQKALLPIVVTLSGILMLVSDLQPAKALLSILVTLFEILMLVRELQSEYLLLVDYQYYTL